MRQPIVTVIDPAVSLLLVDLATAKDELGIADTNMTQDARISRWLAQISAQIYSYCDRIFPAQIYRNVFSEYPYGLYRTDELRLSEYPVMDILGITESNTVLSESDYQVNYVRGLISRIYTTPLTTPWATAEVTVDFRAGYDPIPHIIQAAALRMVRWYQGVRGWDDKPRDPFIRAREGETWGRIEYFGNNTPGLEGGMPQEVVQMLQPFVRYSV